MFLNLLFKCYIGTLTLKLITSSEYGLTVISQYFSRKEKDSDPVMTSSDSENAIVRELIIRDANLITELNNEDSAYVVQLPSSAELPFYNGN